MGYKLSFHLVFVLFVPALRDPGEGTATGNEHHGAKTMRSFC